MIAAVLILVTVLAAYRIGFESGRTSAFDEAVELLAAEQRHPAGWSE